jgi:hypothetical protein
MEVLIALLEAFKLIISAMISAMLALILPVVPVALVVGIVCCMILTDVILGGDHGDDGDGDDS